MNRRVCVMVALVMMLSPVLLGAVASSGGGKGAEAGEGAGAGTEGVEVQNRAVIIVNASGGGDYTCIQWAIDNASDDDTIYVEAGLYRENVFINKSISVIGMMGWKNTIIDGEGKGDVIQINTDGVNVTGLKVINSSSNFGDAGIELNQANYCRIYNNNCSNNGHGIRLYSSFNNVCYNNICYLNIWDGISFMESGWNNISNNTCTVNRDGIVLEDSSNKNTIYYNICTLSRNNGIFLSNTNNDNNITNNICNSNSRGIYLLSNSNHNSIRDNSCNQNYEEGIRIESGSDNNISNNECNSNEEYGIILRNSIAAVIENNRCIKNGIHGVALRNDSNYNEISENVIDSNSMNGIYILDSNNNVLNLNTIINSGDYGISLRSLSKYNTLTNNTLISNTDYGIYTTSDNHLIYHNNLIWNNNNNTQASDHGRKNSWNTSDEGNYWSNWILPDINSNGIVDVPYNLSGSANAQDHFPLVNPISELLIIANAGSDVIIDKHQTVTFDGTSSWGYPAIANYTWTFNYNSTPVFLYGSTPSFTFDILGTYLITLTVKNESGNSDTDRMNVHVRDGGLSPDTELPKAVAGPDKTIHQGETFVFNASGSTDNIGIVNYTWNFTYNGADVTLYGISPSFTFDIPGTYHITLNVSDARGNRATDSMTLTVRDSTWPKANAGANILIGQHEVAMFNASDSTDNVGIVNYTWSFHYRAKEIHLHDPIPSFRFDDAGTYTVTLNVTDAEGLWDTDTLTVTVRDITPPIAVAGDDITVDAGDAVNFNASESTDNVAIGNYTWTFRYDDTIHELYGVSQSFTFDIPGTYTITLTVGDFEGNLGRDNLTVTVLERPSSLELDSDNDTFNDTYENASGSDPYDPLSTPLDLDGDGWNNKIETQVGTNPRDALSVPPDMDGDGITDSLDPDIDGDGVPNDKDPYPFDIGRMVEDEGGTALWWWIVIVVGVVIVVAVVVAVMVVRRKESGEGVAEVDENESDMDDVGRVRKEGANE